jgi:hypothetical protein
MNIEITKIILINAGYVLMLVGLLMRDILWLRLMLMMAQLLLGGYGLIRGDHYMAAWNFVFVGINLARTVRLLNERRPIHLARDQEQIYKQLFLSMTRREFLFLWEMGNPGRIDGAQLVREGELQRDLVLLLSGEVVVRKGEENLARLQRGQFVAEMSFISGEPASANVIADGRVEYMAWPQDKLRALQQLNPGLLVKLQHILGRDLTGKVKAASQRG